MKLGFSNVKVLKGGFVDWTDADYPIEPVTEEEYSFGEAAIGGEEEAP